MNETILHSRQWIDVVKYKWVWIITSILFVIPGIIGMIYLSATQPDHAPLKVGIDYSGGTISQYSVTKEVPNEEIPVLRKGFADAGIENPVVQVLRPSSTISQEKDEDRIGTIISVRTSFQSNDVKAEEKIATIIKKDYPDAKLVQVSSIGPTLGKELLKNSITALLLAFLGIVAYLTIRFQLDYALIALFSLMLDAVFVIGFFALMGIFYDVHIDALFITAIMTVMGFSIHDTIVVFDRVRENSRFFAKKASFGEIVNASVNQTLARSINTSLTVLITLGALFVFGGETTKEFVLAMLIGIAVGTYSSIFCASTMLAWWRDAHDKQKAAPAKEAVEA